MKDGRQTSPQQGAFKEKLRGHLFCQLTTRLVKATKKPFVGFGCCTTELFLLTLKMWLWTLEQLACTGQDSSNKPMVAFSNVVTLNPPCCTDTAHPHVHCTVHVPQPCTISTTQVQEPIMIVLIHCGCVHQSP